MANIPYSLLRLVGSVLWLSGKASDSGARGLQRVYLRRVVFFSKTLYSLKVLVVPRKGWLRPDMTEKLLTGKLNLNTNKTEACMPEKY